MTLRVATFNVNGIRAAQRRGFEAWLAERDPDVVALQEVRCPPAQLPAGVFGDHHLTYEPGHLAGAAVDVFASEPATDLDLDQVLQALVVGLTGLPGDWVRARWQPNDDLGEERPRIPSIGTTWSSSPCMTSTGTSIAFRSSVWSVSEKALMPS